MYIQQVRPKTACEATRQRFVPTCHDLVLSRTEAAAHSPSSSIVFSPSLVLPEEPRRCRGPRVQCHRLVSLHLPVTGVACGTPPSESSELDADLDTTFSTDAFGAAASGKDEDASRVGGGMGEERGSRNNTRFCSSDGLLLFGVFRRGVRREFERMEGSSGSRRYRGWWCPDAGVSGGVFVDETGALVVRGEPMRHGGGDLGRLRD